MKIKYLILFTLLSGILTGNALSQNVHYDPSTDQMMINNLPHCTYKLQHVQGEFKEYIPSSTHAYGYTSILYFGDLSTLYIQIQSGTNFVTLSGGYAADFLIRKGYLEYKNFGGTPVFAATSRLTHFGGGSGMDMNQIDDSACGVGPASGIAGMWSWFTGSQVEFKADGTARSSKNSVGTWRLEGDVYIINWTTTSGEHFEDRLTLSANGRELRGTNDRGTKISGSR